MIERSDFLFILRKLSLYFSGLSQHKRYLCNIQWKPIGLWDVKAPTFSRQSAHRLLWGCQPYAPASRPLTPGRFLVLISVKRLSRPQGHRATGRIRSIEKSSDLIGNRTRDRSACSILREPSTLSLVEMLQVPSSYTSMPDCPSFHTY
jgi:hypothetical protein